MSVPCTGCVVPPPEQIQPNGVMHKIFLYSEGFKMRGNTMLLLLKKYLKKSIIFFRGKKEFV